jgi:8-amino-7-oxononanoate synthase
LLPDLTAELRVLKDSGLYRSPRTLSGPVGPTAVVDGREVLVFCANDYLGLSRHPRLIAAAAHALQRYGCSPAASRLISGTTDAHTRLETGLAAFLGVPSALTFPTGYAANLGVLTALLGRDDAVFSDRLNHRSIVDGCRLSGAAVHVYRHRDVDHLRELLATGSPKARRRLVVTDGLFSMDGDLAPLPDLIRCVREAGAILMVDDAHATGVLGDRGRGTAEHCGVKEGVDVLMTAGSKALGAFGGFIAGAEALTDLLINRAASFIYTTALPADQCAAVGAALDLISTDPGIRRRLWTNVRRVREGLLELGFDIKGSRTQILPVLMGGANRTMAVSQALFEDGILVTGIRPPTVPEGTARLRLSVTAAHTDAHIDRLLDAMARIRSRFPLTSAR